MIIGLIIAAALLAGIISFFILTPTYESSSQFIVNQTQDQSAADAYNVNDIRTNVEMINTYNVIIKSPAILDEVVQKLNLPYGAKTLSDKLQVSSEQDSQVVTVTVTDPSAEMATEIANATVDIFQSEIPEIMNVDNVSVLSKAETLQDQSPVAPKPLLNIAIAIVLGGMVGVGLAFLLEYLDSTVKTEEDIEKKLGLPVLGTISHISDEDIRSTQMRTRQQSIERGGRRVSQKKSV